MEIIECLMRCLTLKLSTLTLINHFLAPLKSLLISRLTSDFARLVPMKFRRFSSMETLVGTGRVSVPLMCKKAISSSAVEARTRHAKVSGADEGADMGR